jgi:hypothetical protein
MQAVSGAIQWLGCLATRPDVRRDPASGNLAVFSMRICFLRLATPAVAWAVPCALARARPDGVAGGSLPPVSGGVVDILEWLGAACVGSGLLLVVAIVAFLAAGAATRVPPADTGDRAGRELPGGPC